MFGPQKLFNQIFDPKKFVASKYLYPCQIFGPKYVCHTGAQLTISGHMIYNSDDQLGPLRGIIIMWRLADRYYKRQDNMNLNLKLQLQISTSNFNFKSHPNLNKTSGPSFDWAWLSSTDQIQWFRVLRPHYKWSKDDQEKNIYIHS